MTDGAEGDDDGGRPAEDGRGAPRGEGGRRPDGDDGRQSGDERPQSGGAAGASDHGAAESSAAPARQQSSLEQDARRLAEATGAVQEIGGDTAGPDPDGGFRAILRTSFVTGAAIVVPLLVTVVVLVVVASVVSDVIWPFAVALSWLPVGVADPLVLEVATIVVLLAAMLVVGYVSAYRPGPSRFVGRRLEHLLESLPGIGAVYRSFNQMSKLLVDSDSQSFKEVVLVEYPTRGSYVVAFRTGTPSDVVQAATGHPEMVTLFMPMGPNPVLGGFVLHISADRVHEVDLTVEEGIRSIVTSGVATGPSSSRDG